MVSPSPDLSTSSCAGRGQRRELATLRIWIDATAADDGIRVFGMTLLERLLRGLLPLSEVLEEVRIELPAGAAVPGSIPQELARKLPLRGCAGDGMPAKRLERALAEAAGEPIVALSADSVVDERLVLQLRHCSGNVALLGGEGAERSAVLKLESGVAGLGGSGADLPSIAETLLRSGGARALDEGDFDGYIVNLRRSVPPYVFRVADAASRDRVESFLFWSNYKGSTDFLTKYVYPPAVWAILRPLARWRVHPNWVTGVGILATLGAIPLFAQGHWVSGLALAYAMSVLDSVDGKLARLTFTSSKIGNVLDHGSDILHPPLWYMAWAWSLGGGDPASPVFQASLWMLGFYAADRVIAMLFRARTGVQIHGITPLDERLRTFISRRNVNLALFTVALFVDWLAPGLQAALHAFYLIVVWQALSGIWHADRLLRFWNARGLRQPASLPTPSRRGAVGDPG